MSPFTLSIETAPGVSEQHGFHLGTIEALARVIVADKFAARVAYGLPVITMALMRDGRVFDVYHGAKWDSDYAAEMGLDHYESECEARAAGHAIASYTPSTTRDSVAF